MHNANIEISNNTSVGTIKLESPERQKLRKRTTGYRKLASTAKEIGVNRNTLYNAMAGKKLTQEVAGKIRTFLNPQPVEQSL